MNKDKNVVENLIAQLETLLGPGGVLGPDDIAQRAVSYWDSRPKQGRVLLRPKTVDELSAAMKLCHEAGQSVIVQGGNTSCVEGTVSGPEDIILSLELLSRICEIDPVTQTVTVEAGVILETLQKAVEVHGLFLPLDLGARGSCTIGGNLATNAGGVNVLRYGMARALVLGLEVVLPDGTVLSSLDKMLKNNAGYDLKQIFVGSEGTLGIITRAVLRLVPKPVTQNTALVGISRFCDVITLLNGLKARIGTTLSAFEVMWGDYYRAVTEPGGHDAPLSREHNFYVLFEAEGYDPERDSALFMEVLEQHLDSGIIKDGVIAQSDTDRQNFWIVRDDFDAILRDKPVFLYDVSLSLSHMEDYVTQVRAALKKKLPMAKLFVFGHIGDGNLHLFVQAGEHGADVRERSDKAIYLPLAPFSGSISAEHGIGHEKKAWLSQSRSEAEIAVMRQLKTSFDPKNTLNPGLLIG